MKKFIQKGMKLITFFIHAYVICAIMSTVRMQMHIQKDSFL